MGMFYQENYSNKGSSFKVNEFRSLRHKGFSNHKSLIGHYR